MRFFEATSFVGVLRFKMMRKLEVFREVRHGRIDIEGDELLTIFFLGLLVCHENHF